MVFGIQGCKNKSSVGKTDPSAENQYAKTGSVERLSPLMDEIIKPGVLPEIIADSFIGIDKKNESVKITYYLFR